MNQISETKGENKTPPRTFGDNMRQLKFNLTAFRADLKFIRRVIYREIKYFIPLRELFNIFLILGILIIFFLIILIFGLPLLISLYDQEGAAELFYNLIIWDGIIFNRVTLQWAAAIISVGTILIRLMIKSPILKYRDKVNTKKDVTYVFGSSRPAEQFLDEMIFQYGYEEKVSLISEVDLLWIRKLGGLVDIYIVEDLKEFEKPNLFDIIGFKNASRIMILTESVELNQNILTNIRRIKPNIEIILLSQYAPAFVFSEVVKDDNLNIIDDLDATIQGLVLSLSMDFDFPPTVEIDVPRTYVGSTGVKMTSDLIKQKVLLIRRGNDLLPPAEIMQLGDRVIIYYYENFFMKLTNRVVTELPLRPKIPKEKKKKKKKKKEKEKEKMKEDQKIIKDDNSISSQLDMPIVGVPVVETFRESDSGEETVMNMEKDDEVI
ncbi:MAG: hypothetical protein ACXAC8_05930 [Candidatus Hodarchaeales archaeon]